MSLRVLKLGLYTLVVDLGRPHCRSLGMTLGGAADRASLMLGNALVGNPPEAAGLEFTLTGPKLEAECDLACVVYGAPFALHGDCQELTAGKTFALRAGEVLRIGATREGMRGYLCVHGGLQTPVILGSRSGLKPVQTGDVLPCPAGIIGARFFLRDALGERARVWGESHPSPLSIRVVRGPQSDWFKLEEIFFVATFRVASASNRMGLRLEGPLLQVPDRELVSEPVCPGAVQVTREGQCIVLGIDGQSIGGYPKIAQVISADLDALGQARPGDTLAFTEIALVEAEILYRDRQAELRSWMRRLQVAFDRI